jgi:hypothetical protein
VNNGPFDNRPKRPVDQSPLRAALTEVTAWEADAEIGGLASRSDVIAL